MSGLAYFACKKCKDQYAVAAADPDISLTSSKMRCPKASACGSTLEKLEKKRKKPVTYLTAKELYIQCSGAGDLNERTCPPKKLHEFLLGKKIIAMDLEIMPGKSRSLVNSITVEGGWTIHLATSTKGATAYKMTKEGI